jgi:hypothetical protein
MALNGPMQRVIVVFTKQRVAEEGNSSKLSGQQRGQTEESGSGSDGVVGRKGKQVDAAPSWKYRYDTHGYEHQVG